MLCAMSSVSTKAKINHRLYLKIIAVLTLTAILAFSVVIYRRINLTRQLNDTSREYLNEKKQVFESTKQLSHGLMDAFRTDYTIWDEMVDAVESRDDVWFGENLPEALTTYGADAVWIFNSNYELVYCTVGEQVPKSEFPIADLNRHAKNLFKDGYFVDFHARIGDKIYKIMGAPVQPTADIERSTVPRGYMFTARELGDKYLKELSLVNSAVVKVDLDSQSSEPVINTYQGKVRFYESIYGWQGQTIGRFIIESYSKVLERDAILLSQQVLLFSISMILTMIVIFTSIAVLILGPLHKLSSAMANSDRQKLDGLIRRNDELGYAAYQIQESWDQKLKLEYSNKELEQIKKQLESQIRDSERMNDLMVNRELKMIELKGKIQEIENGLASKKSRASKKTRNKRDTT